MPAQAQPSTPVTPEQPASQSVPLAPNPTEPIAQPSAPAIPPEVQAQLDAAQARSAELEKQARYHQSRADQFGNQLKAIVGAAPAQNPLDPFLKTYTDKGINPDDARVLAERDYHIEQRFSQLQNGFVAQNQIPAVMQQVYSQAPQLFQNPAVQQAMQQALADAAAQGDMSRMTPDYALNVGAIEFVRASMLQQQAAPPVQQPQFRSQFGPVGQFSPPPVPQQQTNQPPAHIQQHVANEAQMLKERFNFQPPSK